MPFDKNGSELREGQIVTIHCRVRITHPGDEHNNVVLETIEEHYPSNSYSTIVLNSKQVQRVE